ARHAEPALVVEEPLPDRMVGQGDAVVVVAVVADPQGDFAGRRCGSLLRVRRRRRHELERHGGRQGRPVFPVHTAPPSALAAARDAIKAGIRHFTLRLLGAMAYVMATPDWEPS